MPNESNKHYSLEVLSDLRDTDVQNFTGLLEILTDRPQEVDQVETHLQRAIDTRNTTVLATRKDRNGPIVATATLNKLPVLSNEGSVMWIDDVVVEAESQGKGLSKPMMNFLEGKAELYAPKVLLTSSPERGPARSGYTNRGYELSTPGLWVFRNSELKIDHSSDTSPLTDYKNSDIETMALLLKQDPEILELNLRAILASTVSAVFIKKHRGAITAVATANLCPIPTGSKPWIDNYTGVDAGDKLAVLNAGEQWLIRKQVPYVNIIAASDEGLSTDYKRRSTGLFIKQLNLASTQR